MADIVIQYIDEVNIKIIAEPSIKYEMGEEFSFFASNYKFIPAYKNKMWDGKIRLLNTLTGLIYNGLLDRIIEFANSRDYSIEIDPKIRPKVSVDENIGIELGKQYSTIEPRDYQANAVYNVLNNCGRGLIISPTASGKSLIMYLLARQFNSQGNRVLIVVPLLSLVKQLPVEFNQYNNSEIELDFGFYGDSKIINPDADYVFTTWQSIVNKPKEWFNQFGAVIGDEAHLFVAKSLTKILSNLTHCKNRVSVTGTLDEAQVNQLTLEGLFGPTFTVIKTRELIDQGSVSDLKINILTLKYDQASRQQVSLFKTYPEEIEWLINNQQRNKLIKNLTISTKGNTLLLFRFESHGDILNDLLKDNDRPVYYLHGKTKQKGLSKLDLRENIRQEIENHDNAIVIASMGIFSTGVSIKKIHNIIRAHPSKGKVKNLQSIGRGLRLAEGKTHVNLYDLIDDLSYKSKSNHSLKHGMERIKVFNQEQFDYKIFNIEVKSK